MAWVLLLAFLLQFFNGNTSVLLGPLAPWKSQKQSNIFLSFHQHDVSLIQKPPPVQSKPIKFQGNLQDITFFIDLLNNNRLYGNWFNQKDTKQGYFFHEESGVASTDSIASVGEDKNSWNIYLSILDGGYLTSKAISLTIDQYVPSFEFNKNNASFTGSNFYVRVFFYGNNKTQDSFEFCPSDISIFFIDLHTKGPFNQDSKEGDLAVQFQIESDNCDLSFSTDILTTTKISSQELIVYISLMCVAAFSGALSSERLMAGFPQQANKLGKVSIWSLCLINAWDFFLFVFHAAFFLVFSGWLVIITIFFFALSALYETKLTYAVFFSTHQAAGLNFSVQRKFLASYYIILMIFNMSYIYWSYNPKVIWMLLSSSFFLFPQIVRVYQRGRNYKFNFWQVVGFSLSRVTFIAYMTLYPRNIYGNAPMPMFAYIYFGIILFQIFILMIQTKWPKFCLTPKHYSYHYLISNEEDKQEICAICTETLAIPPVPHKRTNNLKKPLLAKETSVAVMRTPCHHLFHEECLTAWIKVKLVCPFDRAPLPPLNNEDID